MSTPGESQGASQSQTRPSQPREHQGHRNRGGRQRRGAGTERSSTTGAASTGPATSEPGHISRPEDGEASGSRGGRGRGFGRGRGASTRQSTMAPQRTFGGRLTVSTPAPSSSLSGDAPVFVPGQPIAQRRYLASPPVIVTNRANHDIQLPSKSTESTSSTEDVKISRVRFGNKNPRRYRQRPVRVRHMHKRSGALLANLVLLHLLDGDASPLRQEVAQEPGQGCRATTERIRAQDMEVSRVQLRNQRRPRTQLLLVR